MTVELSILIVCYKSASLIGDCLRGIFDHTRGCTYEVLLLDNSADRTAELVERDFPAVKIIPTQRNLGFAGGNNELARHAAGEFVLLLNPDTLVRDNALGELVAFARATPQAGAWGGVTILPSGARDPSCMQALPTLGRIAVSMLGRGKSVRGGLPDPASKSGEVEILTGAFMMLSAERWRQLGGFDESFFMYSEEVDLFYRLRQRGLPVLMTPAATVVHLVGSGSTWNPRRQMAQMQGRMHFMRKHHGWLYATAAGWMYWFHAAFRVAGGHLLGWAMNPAKARDMREACLPLVLSPARWWRGYQGHAPTSQPIDAAGIDRLGATS